MAQMREYEKLETWNDENIKRWFDVVNYDGLTTRSRLLSKHLRNPRDLREKRAKGALFEDAFIVWTSLFFFHFYLIMNYALWINYGHPISMWVKYRRYFIFVTGVQLRKFEVVPGLSWEWEISAGGTEQVLISFILCAVPSAQMHDGLSFPGHGSTSFRGTRLFCAVPSALSHSALFIMKRSSTLVNFALCIMKRSST